jgi:hypothetical protein
MGGRSGSGSGSGFGGSGTGGSGRATMTEDYPLSPEDNPFALASR